MKNLKYKKSLFFQVINDLKGFLIGVAILILFVATGLMLNYFFPFGEKAIKLLGETKIATIFMTSMLATLTGALTWGILFLIGSVLCAAYDEIYSRTKGYLEKVDIIRRLPTDIEELKCICIKSYNDFALFAFSFFLVKASITRKIFCGRRKFVENRAEADCYVSFDDEIQNAFFQLGKSFDPVTHDEIFAKIKKEYEPLIFGKCSDDDVAYVFLNARILEGTLSEDRTEWIIVDDSLEPREGKREQHPVTNVYNLFFDASDEVKQICTGILKKKGFDLCFQEDKKISLKIRGKH